MSFPYDFLNIQNFELAWERVLRGSNAQYKRHFSHLFPSYNISAEANLRALLKSIRANHYSPSSPTTIYYPKSSRILRPITLLTLNDQIVYQAITNYVADRFHPTLSRNYAVKTFGAQLSGSKSPFFYRPWKTSYREFNRAIRRSYFLGNSVIADFDLVSFFDLIDHKILRKILEKQIRNGEILDLLNRCLEKWTSGNPSAYLKGHGIPQGPEPSAFLAEIILSDFDKARHKNVVYLRYVDDIKLLGQNFPPVRRALLRLDLQAKKAGLVPQAQKIDIRRVTDISTQVKSVPSLIASATAPYKAKLLSKSMTRRLNRMLRNSVASVNGEVTIVNETHFKFALHRLPPSRRTLRLVRPLCSSRPDLSGALARFIGRFSNSRKITSALSDALKSDPVFDATGGDYALGLDKCVGLPGPKRIKKLINKLIAQSEEKSILLDVPCKVFLYKRGTLKYLLASLKTEPSALAASQLINWLCFDRVHASVPPRNLISVVSRFANHSRDDDLCRYCTYLLLSEFKRWPRKPGVAGALLMRHLGWAVPMPKISLLSNFFKEFFKLKPKLEWERFMGKRAHAEAQRRTVVLRGCWHGNPSLFVTVLDNFNDLLLQRLSVKHKNLANAFKKAAGKDRIPNYGAWLRDPSLVGLLPKSNPILLNCHDLRLRADIAHATQKKSGQFTRPISYFEKDKLIKEMKTAYKEILSVYATL